MRLLRACLTLLALALPVAAQAAITPITLCDAVWLDAARSREVPVRIRMPAGRGKLPLIVFSHGLGGSLEAGTMWAHAWATSGFAVINLQHAGSDSALFGKPDFKSALNSVQLAARARDVQFALNEIGRKPFEGKCELRRIDTARIGMAGHSFGAQTTLAVVGQTFPTPFEPSLSDPRIRAAIGFSPSPPLTGSPEAAFANIRIPFLSITGTQDAIPNVIAVTALQRQLPYRLMPPGDKFLLVMEGGTHAMFAGQSFSAGSSDREPTPHIRDTVIAITTAFWRAVFNDDKPALRWLLSPEGARAGLPAQDKFESK
ncbi:alpha/beta hydrolase family protein [Sphingomonas montanisoli]|uniref:Dienelactone hydrolase n=1 Tax=Sphingomonas montanisoli TaxID=2606412 RepID=A0A5D9CBC4_9SPHN|nr:dienelactone hydrolase [Sphingomonas montanisoli]TZG27421.1 dienelactone hydrolase [Sphingomonas montanisoli]